MFGRAQPAQTYPYSHQLRKFYLILFAFQAPPRMDWIGANAVLSQIYGNGVGVSSGVVTGWAGVVAGEAPPSTGILSVCPTWI